MPKYVKKSFAIMRLKTTEFYKTYAFIEAEFRYITMDYLEF